ncbi:hypothetical protein LALCM10_100034 [Dellaglioa algida]|nr:hypothetical protein LALCM10_100034 [Dellaglioa algida]
MNSLLELLINVIFNLSKIINRLMAVIILSVWGLFVSKNKGGIARPRPFLGMGPFCV